MGFLERLPSCSGIRNGDGNASVMQEPPANKFNPELDQCLKARWDDSVVLETLIRRDLAFLRSRKGQERVM
jgi:hypothetical protein